MDQPSTSQGSAPEQQQEATFLPSPSFTGAKEGYVFTTGQQGTGYYKDEPLHLRTKAAAAKPKPLALKSSSIVKGLRKPAGLPDAKKRKTDESDSNKPAYLKEMDRYQAMNCSSNTQHDRPLVK